MGCKHERLRCTDNRFFCLNCGAEVFPEAQTDKNPSETEKTSEAPKKAVKRTSKKKAGE